MFSLFSTIDDRLLSFVEQHGAWSYGVLFLVLTCEVGLVVTPLVPGESLLFASGALAASDVLFMPALLVGFAVAAILGNLLGYSIGRLFGRNLLESGRIPFVSAGRLAKLKGLFDSNPKYAIVYTRFVPLLRALTPFVAGAVAMSFNTFALYSAIGGVIWTLLCTSAGYFFGQLSIVKENFSLAVLAVVVLASIPTLCSAVLARRRSTANELNNER